MGRISALIGREAKEPWRRGATGFCKLSWQLLVVVKLWLLFPFVSHRRLILVVYAWWILLQSWGTMRFSDHRGLKLSDGPHLVMLLSVSAVMAQHRLGSPEKSR